MKRVRPPLSSHTTRHFLRQPITNLESLYAEHLQGLRLRTAIPGTTLFFDRLFEPDSQLGIMGVS